MFLAFLIGVLLALGVAVSATLVGIDRQRAFYSTVVVVIASYNVLFATLGGDPSVLPAEILLMAVFMFFAVLGFKVSQWFAVIGLIGHGELDMFHGHMIDNPGVPQWWPMFCATYDVVAGAYLAWLILRRGEEVPAIRPHVEAELRAAEAAEAAGDDATSFRHLERAHILSQSSTVDHVRVHVRMLKWAHRRQQCEDMAGQIWRIIGAAVLTPFGAVPRGNTGGSNVAGFQAMMVPPDLDKLMADVGRESC